MHELGIADSIVQTVLKKMEEDGYNRVTKIALRIGALTDIVPDALEFGFEAITRDTALQDTALEIEQVPVHAKCRGCGREFTVDEFIFVCPHCDGISIEMSSGDELEIAYIEVDDDS